MRVRLLHKRSQPTIAATIRALEQAGASVEVLASDDASYITGDVIKVDGGMLAQQRSATVDIMPPSDFPQLEDL